MQAASTALCFDYIAAANRHRHIKNLQAALERHQRSIDDAVARRPLVQKHTDGQVGGRQRIGYMDSIYQTCSSGWRREYGVFAGGG